MNMSTASSENGNGCLTTVATTAVAMTTDDQATTAATFTGMLAQFYEYVSLALWPVCSCNSVY